MFIMSAIVYILAALYQLSSFSCVFEFKNEDKLDEPAGKDGYDADFGKKALP
ncbi:MAG: hypothetical protein SO412_02105 [Erysipelotrichaceae bacterium]|nr:hypothetical protein [Erysipelotrichaceae bacterium]